MFYFMYRTKQTTTLSSSVADKSKSRSPNAAQCPNDFGMKPIENPSVWTRYPERGQVRVPGPDLRPRTQSHRTSKSLFASKTTRIPFASTFLLLLICQLSWELVPKFPNGRKATYIVAMWVIVYMYKVCVIDVLLLNQRTRTVYSICKPTLNITSNCMLFEA